MTWNTRLLAASALLLAAAGGLSPAHAVPPSDNSQLVGTWINTAPGGGLVKVVVTAGAPGVNVHPFGACSPTPCDQGTKHAQTFSDGVASSKSVGLRTALFNFGFKSQVLTAHLIANPRGGAPLLEVVTQSRFAAGDTRGDYELVEDFARTP